LVVLTAHWLNIDTQENPLTVTLTLSLGMLFLAQSTSRAINIILKPTYQPKTIIFSYISLMKRALFCVA